MSQGGEMKCKTVMQGETQTTPRRHISGADTAWVNPMGSASMLSGPDPLSAVVLLHRDPLWCVMLAHSDALLDPFA